MSNILIFSKLEDAQSFVSCTSSTNGVFTGRARHQVAGPRPVVKTFTDLGFLNIHPHIPRTTESHIYWLRCKSVSCFGLSHIHRAPAAPAVFWPKPQPHSIQHQKVQSLRCWVTQELKHKRASDLVCNSERKSWTSRVKSTEISIWNSPAMFFFFFIGKSDDALQKTILWQVGLLRCHSFSVLNYCSEVSSCSDA